MKNLKPQQIISYAIAIILIMAMFWVFIISPPCDGNYNLRIGGNQYFLFECKQKQNSREGTDSGSHPPKNTDQCKYVKCKNGGKCKNGKCKCPKGFKGDNCETYFKKIDLTFIGWAIEPSNDKNLKINKRYTARIGIVNKGINKIINGEIRYYTHSNGAPSKKWKVNLEPGEKKEIKYRFKYTNKYSQLSTKITLDEFNKLNDINRQNNIWSKQIEVN